MPEPLPDPSVTKRGVCVFGGSMAVCFCVGLFFFCFFFAWLVTCLSVTEPSNVISILISSEFLKMDTLVSVEVFDVKCEPSVQAFCFSDV